MWTLDRKLLRELWLQGGQTVAIVLISICGSASFVATGSVYRSLKQTRAAYYERYRFAQLFAQLKRAHSISPPESPECRESHRSKRALW